MSDEAPSEPVDAGAATLAADPSSSHTGRENDSVESWLAQVAAAPDVPIGPAPGETIGESFVIERQLGQGGMGVVYLAHHAALDRKVAIKLHRVHSPRAAERLLREARALAHIEHEHVIVVHEVGAWHRYVFVAMEYVDGWTAREWVAETPRTWREVVALYRKAGRGLQAAHERGLIHRDFKPDNVLVGRDGRVRVADFGLVRAAGEMGSGDDVSSARVELAVSITDGLVGSPAYMAPEQFSTASVDAHADQFGFCVSLFEALAGERPFVGDDMASFAQQIVLGRAKELDPRRAPAHIRAALRRGLQVDPQARFPDMAALLAELGRDPALVWRRRIVAGAALAATGLVTWSLARAPDPMVECVASPPIESWWTGDRAERVHAALAGTARPFAEDSFTRIDAHMGEHVAEARDVRQRGCIAAHVEGSRSKTELGAHKQCLAQRQRELDALIELFERSPAEVIERSVAAVAGLPAAAVCDIDRIQRVDDVAPEDRARVDALWDAVARTDEQLAAGLYDEAIATAEAMRPEASALGYPASEGQLLLSLAVAHDRLRDPDVGGELLRQALRLAIAADDDELTAQVAVHLILNDGYIARPSEKADAWASLADDLLEHIGRPAGLQSLYFVNHALALRASEKFDASNAEVEAALAILDPSDDVRRGPALAVLGETHRRMGRLDLAIPRLEESVEAYERALGPAHPSYANALNILGAAHLDHGDFAAAESTFERALEIAERALDPTSGIVIDMRGNLGIVYANTGRVDEGVAVLERAWSDAKAANRPDDRSLAGLASNLAAMYESAGNGERAMALQAEAIELTRELVGEDSADYGQALIQSAALGRTRDPARALPQVDRGLALLRAKLDEDSAQVANAHIIRGAVLQRLERCDEALVELEIGRVGIEKSMGAEHPVLGDAWLSIAECHLHQRSFGEAVVAAERARKIVRATLGRRYLPAETCLIRAQIGARELDSARAELEELRTWAREKGDDAALDEIEALARTVARK